MEASQVGSWEAGAHYMAAAVKVAARHAALQGVWVGASGFGGSSL